MIIKPIAVGAYFNTPQQKTNTQKKTHKMISLVRNLKCNIISIVLNKGVSYSPEIIKMFYS
jgi:hypothetical protein